MRIVSLDGTEAAVLDLVIALRSALGGGPPVAPIGPDQSADALNPDRDVEPETALIVSTSGSTGNPKGVLLSAEALRASASATHARLGGPGRWLLAMPAHHIAGVQVLVRSLLAGHEPAVLPATGFRPAGFARAAAPVLAAPGRHYTSLVPTQLVRVLADAGAGLDALRAFDAVLVGGAATPTATLTRARAAGVRVVTTYGMSETAGGCVYDGVPLDGVRVRITDGVVELAGPTLANGYRLDPDAPAFRDGWFHTSDLGELTADGNLVVTGRADDVINTGGEKVSAGAVERVLTDAPGVLEACVVGLPDEQWGARVCAAVVTDGTADVRAAVDAVRAALGPHAAPKSVTVVAELPLRGPGKVDRRAVAALLGG